MNTSLFDNTKIHIEASMKVGYEKLDAAIMLVQSKKFSSAVPEFVGAYEEIGYALFLSDGINNSTLTVDTLEDFIKPGTHSQKILSHYISRKDKMVKNPNDDFEKVKNSEIGKQFAITSSREDIIRKINERIAIFSKLHSMRQIFDYSHNRDGTISNKEHDDVELDDLCFLLESECWTSYYVVKMAFESHTLRSPSDTDDDFLSKITVLPSVKKLMNLYKEYNTPNNQNRRHRGLEFIKNLEI